MLFYIMLVSERINHSYKIYFSSLISIIDIILQMASEIFMDKDLEINVVNLLDLADPSFNLKSFSL